MIDPAIALTGMLGVGAAVWTRHVFTRGWNENQEAKRNRGWRVSNHRRFKIEYNRRIIAEAVTGMRRVEVHYDYDGATPLCGGTVGPRGAVLPLIRWVTCPDCHDALQTIMHALYAGDTTGRHSIRTEVDA